MQAERKWEEVLLFKISFIYFNFHKVKLSSRDSILREIPYTWFNSSIIMGSEHPRNRVDLFHKRDVIENVSSETIMDSKVCKH